MAEAYQPKKVEGTPLLKDIKVKLLNAGKASLGSGYYRKDDGLVYHFLHKLIVACNNASPSVLQPLRIREC